jgi:hypothetical protein
MFELTNLVILYGIFILNNLLKPENQIIILNNANQPEKYNNNNAFSLTGTSKQ